MIPPRIMPCLLLRDAALVKTIKFKNPSYVGDPINAIRIYNEREVDELIFLDITATLEKKKPPFKILEEIASECFMPVAYGGGIRDLDDMKAIFSLGIEKIAINSYAIENPSFVRLAADTFGSQSIIVAIDAHKNMWGRYDVCTHGGKKSTGLKPDEYALKMQEQGAGEILITSINRDGTQVGYDLELIQKVSKAVTIPVVACGGAGALVHFREAVDSGASACATGSMVVYYGPHRAVLINFPDRKDLLTALQPTGCRS